MRVPIQDAAREAAEIIEFGFLVSDRDLYMTMTREYPRLRGHWEEFVAELETIGRRRRTFAHAGSSWCLHRYTQDQPTATPRRWWQRAPRVQAATVAQVYSRITGGAVTDPSAPAPAVMAAYEDRQGQSRRVAHAELVGDLFAAGDVAASEAVARHCGLFTVDLGLGDVLEEQVRS